MTRLRSLAALGGLIAVAPPLAAQAPDLAVARARWAQAQVGAYEYGYNKFCECHGDTPPETLVTVVDGRVVGVRHQPVGSDREVVAVERNLQYYWTIEDLFALVESALASEATVRVRFDERLGYPTSVYIDYSQSTIGDEIDVRLTRLTVR